MREHKYKAWCDCCQEFVPIMGLIHQSDNGLVVYCPMHEGGAVETTLVQFTGLLDSEGTEIYESDLVLLPEYGDVYKQVIFHKGCFCVHGFNWNVKACKVIGSIHENPELLEEA